MLHWQFRLPASKMFRLTLAQVSQSGIVDSLRIREGIVQRLSVANERND
jgi:hypothetical protein